MSDDQTTVQDQTQLVAAEKPQDAVAIPPAVDDVSTKVRAG